MNLYKAEAQSDIKALILDSLKKKQTKILMNCLQLLKNIPELYKDSDIFTCLEDLLDGPSKIVKKEIIKLFEKSNENITNYLLQMFDDQSKEIRIFAYEKLCKINDFHGIDSNKKVEIFYVGLSDPDKTIQDYTKKILKNYLSYLGIIKNKFESNDTAKSKDDSKMDIDDNNININNISVNNSVINNNDSFDEHKDFGTAQSKISQLDTPMKPVAKKLQSSPSRIFDELNVIKYYSNPTLSYVFVVITDAIINIIDREDITKFCKEIVDNICSIVNRLDDSKDYSIDKKKDSFISSNKKIKYDKYYLFNDLYFLQSIYIIYNIL